MKITSGIIDQAARQYLGAVSAALNAAGFAQTETFSEAVVSAETPDYVVRVTLAGGTVVDLIWDTLSWLVIVYPGGGPNPHDDKLSALLTDDADALPETVARLVRPTLTEAQRLWPHGKPAGGRAPAAAVAVKHDHDPLLPCYSRCRAWGSADRAKVLGERA